MSEARGLVFEEFPTEIRLMIYRLLLVNEEASEEFDRLFQVTRTSCQPEAERNAIYQTFDPLAFYDFNKAETDRNDPQIKHVRRELWKASVLHPGILRANKMIHEEAAQVLYGANVFKRLATGGITSDTAHLMETRIPQRYSCLVAKLHLTVQVNHPRRTQGVVRMATISTFDSVRETCASIGGMKLRLLKVEYLPLKADPAYQSYMHLIQKYAGSFTEENCLAPLKEIKATKFSINGPVTPTYANDLKHAIETQTRNTPMTWYNRRAIPLKRLRKLKLQASMLHGEQ